MNFAKAERAFLVLYAYARGLGVVDTAEAPAVEVAIGAVC